MVFRADAFWGKEVNHNDECKAENAVYGIKNGCSLAVYTLLSALHTYLAGGVKLACKCLFPRCKALFAAVRAIIDTIHSLSFPIRRGGYYPPVDYFFILVSGTSFLRFFAFAIPNMRKCSRIISPVRNIPREIPSHSQFVSLDFAAIYTASPTITTVQKSVTSLRDILILRKKLRILALSDGLFSVIADIMQSISHAADRENKI